MQLILVRHTKTVVPEGICYGQSNVLPQTGFISDAEKVRKKLRPLKPDIIYSSPLVRCTMLAEYCGYSNYITDDRLMEYNFGLWEMKSWNLINDDYALQWFDNFINLPAPGGESFSQMLKRFCNFADEIKKMKLGTVLCFTHSGIIRLADVVFKKTDISEVFTKTVDFGGVYSYTIENKTQN